MTKPSEKVPAIPTILVKITSFEIEPKDDEEFKF